MQEGIMPRLAIG